MLANSTQSAINSICSQLVDEIIYVNVINLLNYDGVGMYGKQFLITMEQIHHEMILDVLRSDPTFKMVNARMLPKAVNQLMLMVANEVKRRWN